MSLYLPDQKLGSRSQPGSSSHKFVIKGRQTGSMHRGHTWVFRAETYETMLAWYDDIKNLTEKSGEERNAFVRRHASVRSTSAGSARSASSDGGLEEDEADAVPYSANQSIASQALIKEEPTRPSPGGRFPSDINVSRNLQAPPSSGSSEIGHDLTTAAGGPQQNAHPAYPANSTDYQYAEPVQPIQHQQEYPAGSYVNAYPPATGHQYGANPQTYENPYSTDNHYANDAHAYDTQYPNNTAYPTAAQHNYAAQPNPFERHESSYGDWMAPAAGGAVGGVAAGALANEAYRRKQMEQHEQAQQQELDQQTPLQNPQQPMTDVNSPAPAVPERDPDHRAPASIPEIAPTVGQTHVPTPIVALGATQTHANEDANRGLATPSSTNPSFLDDSEVGTAIPTSGKTVNGGPVPVELVQAAEDLAHPGVNRTNTDISVSDLHVPGEYPKVPGGIVPLR